MNDITNSKLDAQSYLKSGSNELRILEYRIGDVSFGINILKVSKITKDLVNFIEVPETHTAIKGMFKDMDRLVPLVDLAAFLGISTEEKKHNKAIVTEFFGILTGFWVDRLEWIHHFKWEDVIDAGRVFSGIDQRYVIGIVKPTEERMILMLDYETILLDLCPHLKQADMKKTDLDIDLSGRKILVAEDSPSVRAMMVNEFGERGGEVSEAGDGVEAWEIYQNQVFDLVVCDVEMPRMDGLAVTWQIRQSERPDTPVIVYSSIGDIGMKSRAQFLKANAHITKLNFEKLLKTADKLIRGEKLESEDIDVSASTESNPVEEEVETVPID
ncbi:MAG: chemotaxis protein CheV [candidate division Zixibacteria bacterium]|nr:chemotaxis protein CheV [candidate division Zixibacteria bacterium]